VRPPDHARDRRIVQDCADWFAASARPLPWRTSPRQPYASFVSEVMLQQTQVTRVLERFPRFLARFPTLADLAQAPLADCLALWSGLGYYRRAQNLHAAARQIATLHDGRIPAAVGELLALPGIGRYTAGAISSIVYNQPEPIVDGNIARILLRLEAKPLAHASPQALAWSWKRSAALVAHTTKRRSPALFNEGLMELGAVICTPKSPACDRCPLAHLCLARARNAQHRIPRPKPQSRRKVLHCASMVLTDSRGRILLERRPDSGMWANLWQPPTLESPRPIPRARIDSSLTLAGKFTHQTSHRQVRFTVYRGDLGQRELTAGQQLHGRETLLHLALGSAQSRAIEMAIEIQPPSSDGKRSLPATLALPQR
jgi:A/G-specific adenine glycosylase